MCHKTSTHHPGLYVFNFLHKKNSIIFKYIFSLLHLIPLIYSFLL